MYYNQDLSLSNVEAVKTTRQAVVVQLRKGENKLWIWKAINHEKIIRQWANNSVILNQLKQNSRCNYRQKNW